MVGLAQVLVALDRTEEARSMADQILEFSRTHNDKRSEHFAWHYLADCALIEENYAESLRLYKQSLALANELGDKIETAVEVQGVQVDHRPQQRRWRGDEHPVVRGQEQRFLGRPAAHHHLFR